MSKQRIEYLKDEHWKKRTALEKSWGDMDSRSHFFGIKQLSWMHSMTESEMGSKQSHPAGIFHVRKHFISAPNLFHNIKDDCVNPAKVSQI